MKNLLVIKLRYIGDVVLATPVIRQLREGYPGARITMCVNAGTEAVLKRNEDLDEILIVRRGSLFEQVRFLAALRRRRFDCVVDLTDGDRSAFLTWLSGAPVRVGFNQEARWRGVLYTALVQGTGSMHRVERDLEALRPLGLAPKASPLVLKTDPEDEAEATAVLEETGLDGRHGDGPLVALQPGARYWFKAWPPERFAQLADRLAQELGCRVFVGGSREERDLAERIRVLARSRPVVLAGRVSLSGYAAVLRRCALFVGNDNGPMHMAAALGVPVVALFGPSDPTVWAPCAERKAVIYKGLDCRPCFHPTCRRGEENCMRLIRLQEVDDACRKLLANERDARVRR